MWYRYTFLCSFFLFDWFKFLMAEVWCHSSPFLRWLCSLCSMSICCEEGKSRFFRNGQCHIHMQLRVHKKIFDHVHGAEVFGWNIWIRLFFFSRYIHVNAYTFYLFRSMAGISWVREALYWRGLPGGRTRSRWVGLDPESDEYGYFRYFKNNIEHKTKTIIHVLHEECCHTMCEIVVDLSLRNNILTLFSSVLCRLGLDDYTPPPGEVHHSGI